MTHPTRRSSDSVSRQGCVHRYATEAKSLHSQPVCISCSINIPISTPSSSASIVFIARADASRHIQPIETSLPNLRLCTYYSILRIVRHPQCLPGRLKSTSFLKQPTHLSKHLACAVLPTMVSEERKVQTSNIVSPDPPPETGLRSEETASASTSSVPASIFSLPADVRNNIYRRVLVVAHPLYLFQDTGSELVETFGPDIPRQWFALLYVNRQVRDEASAVLYGSNRFHFMDTTQHQGDLIQSFLNCIGPMNAGLLTHLCINFPVAEGVEGEPGKVMLRKDDLHSLKLLQEHCTRLTTLETILDSRHSRDLMNPSLDDSQINRDALAQIHAQLRAIHSLINIIVKFYGGTPTSVVMQVMEGFGWVILRGR